ncbi:hypothetical protein [Bradyrhizobium sp. USDA 4486]
MFLNSSALRRLGSTLAHDRREAGLRVSVARRELEQKAAHLLAKDIRDNAKIADQRFRALELFDMGDEFANLYGVNHSLAAGLAALGVNVRDGRP